MIVENSCQTPSIRTREIATPSSERSRMRRRALPERRAVSGLERLDLVAAVIQAGLDGFNSELRFLEQAGLASLVGADVIARQIRMRARPCRNVVYRL